MMTSLAQSLHRLIAWHRSKMEQVAAVLPRGRTAAPFLAASIFASSCDGELNLTVNLATQSPSDVEIQEVQVMLQGVEFRRSGGDTQRLEFTDAEQTDLLAFVGAIERVFTDEELPEGTYTGVRLLLETEESNESFVIDGTGAQRELVVSAGDYAEINIQVDEDESADEDVMLTLDLRQSLRFDEEEDRYLLTPNVRAVLQEDAGSIRGVVSACSTTAAVYLFQNEVEPDDIDGQGAEPYLTTFVSTFDQTYEFEFLPAGQYTLAAACDPDEEDISSDDDVDFSGTTTVDLDDGEDLQEDL